MRIEVKLYSEDSNLIERKYFEHSALKDCVAFLMKDKDVNKELLDKYVRNVCGMYYELEKAKRLLSKKYEPQELRGKSYDYYFDFENETITYVAKAD